MFVFSGYLVVHSDPSPPCIFEGIITLRKGVLVIQTARLLGQRKGRKCLDVVYRGKKGVIKAQSSCRRTKRALRDSGVVRQTKGKKKVCGKGE